VQAKLLHRWQEAEEALYTDATDPRFRWDGDTLTHLLQQVGLTVQSSQETIESDLWVSAQLCDRWFAATQPDSYYSRLAATLSIKDLTAIEKVLRRHVQNQTVRWRTQQWLAIADSTTATAIAVTRPSIDPAKIWGQER
jgi:putative ATPase